MPTASHAFVAAQLGITVEAMHARRAARLAPKPADDDAHDFSMDVHCGCCRLMHHIDDDCPVLPRHYYDEGIEP